MDLDKKLIKIPFFPFEGHANGIRAIDISPDGKLLATGGGDYTVRIWDLEAKKLIHVLSSLYSSTVVSVKFSPDGKFLACGGDISRSWIWNLSTRELVFHVEHKYYHSVAFSPDGKLIATGGDKGVYLWDIKSQSLIHTFSGHTSVVNTIAYSPDGKHLASSSWDNTIKIYDIEKKALLHTYDPKSRLLHLNSFQFSPDGKSLVFGINNGNIFLLDISTNTIISSFLGHFGSVFYLCFSDNGNTLVSCGSDKTVRVWDVKSSSLIKKLTGHKDTVSALAISQKTGLIVSSSWDSSIILWDLVSKDMLYSFNATFPEIPCASISPSGKYIATSDWDSKIYLWDAFSKELIHVFDKYEGEVYFIVFSPNERFLACGGSQGFIKFWDMQSKELFYIFEGHNDSVTSLAFITNDIFISGGGDLSSGTVIIWEISTKKVLREFIQSGWFVGFYLLQDGKFVLSYSTDNIILLDSNSKEILTKFDKDTGQPVSRSTDGSYLALDKGVDNEVYSIPKRNKVILTEKEIDSITFEDFDDEDEELEGISLVMPFKETILASFSYDQVKTDKFLQKLISDFLQHPSWVQVGKYDFSKYSEKDSMVVTAFQKIKNLFKPEDLISTEESSEILMSESINNYLKKKQTNLQVKSINTIFNIPILEFTGHSGRNVTALAFSPKGDILASGGGDETLRLWDVKTRRLIHVFTSYTSDVKSIQFSKDGDKIITSGRFHDILIWDLKKREIIESFKEHYWAQNAIFSPDEKYIAGSMRENVYIWKIETKEIVHEFIEHESIEVQVDYSPDGKLLASCAQDGKVCLWNIDKSKLVKKFMLEMRNVKCIKFSPNGKFLAAGGEGGILYIWEVESTELYHVFNLGKFNIDDFKFRGPFPGLEFKPGVGIGLKNNYMKNENYDEFQTSSIEQLNFTSDSKMIFVNGKGIRIFDIENKTSKLFLESGLEQNNYSVIALSNDRGLIAGSIGVNIFIWNLQTKQEILNFKGQDFENSYVSSSPDAQYIATAGWDDSIYVWNVLSRKLHHIFDGQGNHVNGLIFSVDNKFMALAGNNSRVLIWDVRLKYTYYIIETEFTEIYCIAFIKGSDYIAVAGKSNEIIIWDLKSKRIWTKLQNGVEKIYTLAVSPDSKYLAGSGVDGRRDQIFVWDLDTRSFVERFSCINGDTGVLLFSPNGNFLVSGNSHMNICVFNLTTLKKVCTFWNTQPPLRISENSEYIEGITEKGEKIYWFLPEKREISKDEINLDLFRNNYIIGGKGESLLLILTKEQIRNNPVFKDFLKNYLEKPLWVPVAGGFSVYDEKDPMTMESFDSLKKELKDIFE